MDRKPLLRAACSTAEVIFALLVFVVAVVAPAEARAAEVVTVVAEADSPIGERVRRELVATGFDVVFDGPPLRDLPADLARRRGAVGVVWRGAGSIEVWVRRDQAAAAQRSFADPADDPSLVRETALGVAEFIRGVRLGLAHESPPEQRNPAPNAPPETPEHRLFVNAQGGVGVGLAHRSVSAHGLVGVSWMPPIPGLVVSAEGILPTAPARIRDGGNEARVFAGALYVAIRIALSDKRDLVHFDIGPGVGLALAGVYGRAAPPLQTRSQTLPAAVLLGRTGFAVSLGPRVRLRIDGLFGTLVPQLGVRFVAREVEKWGQPIGGGFLGFEVRAL